MIACVVTVIVEVVVDLFAGCDGASQGAESAGCEVVLAMDNNQEATHESNHRT